jgi:hypothetical protein
VPAGKGAVGNLLNPGIAGRDVAEQDVGGAGAAVEVAEAGNTVAGAGTADLVPPGKSAVADRLEPGIP